jgi:hypothetical protein
MAKSHYGKFLLLYFRRIPNTDHNIMGFEESLMSFYMSASDVSKCIDLDV